MAGIELFSQGYGYVILTLVFYSCFNFWMASQVLKARRKYKVLYPTLYALESENKDAKLFNCVQRGHQNSLEWMPNFFMLMIVGGIKHPLTCAVLGMVYTTCRYFYFTGYATGNPENRINPVKLSFYALFGLTLTTISCGIKLILIKHA